MESESDSSSARSAGLTSDGFSLSEYLDAINKEYERIREEERHRNEALKAQEETEPLEEEDEDEVDNSTSPQKVVEATNKENEHPCNIVNSETSIMMKDQLQAPDIVVKDDGIETIARETEKISLKSTANIESVRKLSPIESKTKVSVSMNRSLCTFPEHNNTNNPNVIKQTEKRKKVSPIDPKTKATEQQLQAQQQFITPCRRLPPPKVAQSLPGRTSTSTDSSQPRIMCRIDMRSHLNTPIFQTSTSASKKPKRRNFLSNSSSLDCVLEDDALVGIDDNASESESEPKPLPERKIKDVFKCIKVNHVEYLVLNELGKGGSSVVYHCYDPQRKEECAVKVVDLNKDRSEALGFINEVKALRRLRDCDRIITLLQYQILNDEKQLYMVLEKGDRDFAEILREHSRNTAHLPPFMVHFYWMQMLHAVDQMHSRGVIHSDLKPANFIEMRDRLKLIDFGISSCVQLDMTSVVKTVALGTFGYISPEALCNDRHGAGDQPAYKVGYKSDVWSLGCILYQLVYKRTPFAHIQHNAARLAAIMDPHHVIAYPPADWVPKGVIACIRACLQYNARQRPSVDELIRAEHSMNA